MGREVDVAQPEEHRGISNRPKVLDLIGAGPFPEERARVEAETLIRTARRDSGRGVEGPAPDPGEVRGRREARVRRGSNQET